MFRLAPAMHVSSFRSCQTEFGSKKGLCLDVLRHLLRGIGNHRRGTGFKIELDYHFMAKMFHPAVPAAGQSVGSTVHVWLAGAQESSDTASFGPIMCHKLYDSMSPSSMSGCHVLQPV